MRCVRAVGRQAAIIAAAMGLLAACGFQLRGQAQLPFDTLYVPPGSALAVELKRNVAAVSNTRLVNEVKEADAVLGFTQDAREKVILSYDAAGKVREFQLRYRVGFRVTDPKGKVFVPTSEILLTRDMTFSDTQVLSKESEEALLYRDMQSDMVQQILRRLAASKAAHPSVE